MRTEIENQTTKRIIIYLSRHARKNKKKKKNKRPQHIYMHYTMGKK
jgi:hypothetical protein